MMPGVPGYVHVLSLAMVNTFWMTINVPTNMALSVRKQVHTIEVFCPDLLLLYQLSIR